MVIIIGLVVLWFVWGAISPVDPKEREQDRLDDLEWKIKTNERIKRLNEMKRRAERSNY